MDVLPKELWGVILVHVEDRTLAATIPRVCKLFQQLSSDGGIIWMQRSSDKAHKYTIEGVNKKTAQQTWKQFYFYDPLCFFPLWGISIGKSTRSEMEDILAKNRDLVHEIEGPVIYIEEIDFWMDDNDVFIDINMNLQISKLPDKWQALGLNSSTSVEYVKKLLRECCGNYVEHKEQFLNQTVLTSVIVQKDGTKYDASFSFHAHGATDQPSTLRTIALSDVGGCTPRYLETFYKGKCIDAK